MVNIGPTARFMTAIMDNGNTATITESGMNEQEDIEREIELSELQASADRQAPHLSEVEWINVFPQAKARWGKHAARSLKVIIFRVQGEIELLEWERRHVLRSVYQATGGKEDWVADMIAERFDRQIKDCKKAIRGAEERLRFLRSIGQKEIPGRQKRVDEDMIRRAKEYPIEKLLEINRAGFAKCFLHNDAKPSAYTKHNFLYCFVCAKKWDTIAVLMERDGRKFHEAVRQLQ